MNLFTDMADSELLKCFVILKSGLKTGIISKEPLASILDRYFENSASTGLINMQFDLTLEIANRWFEEHKK